MTKKDLIRQGGVISPTLPAIIMHDIMKELYLAIVELTDFANNLIIYEGNIQDLQYNLKIWRRALATTNLKVIMGKTNR